MPATPRGGGGHPNRATTRRPFLPPKIWVSHATPAHHGVTTLVSVTWMQTRGKAQSRLTLRKKSPATRFSPNTLRPRGGVCATPAPAPRSTLCSGINPVLCRKNGPRLAWVFPFSLNPSLLDDHALPAKVPQLPAGYVAPAPWPLVPTPRPPKPLWRRTGVGSAVAQL